MKQSISAGRQNELVSALLARIRERKLREQELEQHRQHQTETLQKQFAAKRQQISRDTLMQRDEVETEYQRQTIAVREEFDIREKTVREEFEEQREAAIQQAKVSQSDGEYDWFLTKQRLQKEYAADKAQLRDSYKSSKARLKAHGRSFAQLASLAKAALGRHRCELKWHGGDLAQEPADGDHLAAHQDTYSLVQQRVQAFRVTFWVRFQEDKWYLIAFLLGAILSALPLLLILRDLTLSSIIAIAVGVVCALMSWTLSRALATKTAFQYRESFVAAVARGKEQLLAAQFHNKKRYENELKLLADQLLARQEQTDLEWSRLQESIRQRSEQRESELQAWLNKQTVAIREQRQEQENKLASHFSPTLNQFDKQLHEATGNLDNEERRAIAACQHLCDQDYDELAQSWMSGVTKLLDEARRMFQLAEPRMPNFGSSSGAMPQHDAPVQAIRFGIVEMDLADLPDGQPSDPRLRVPDTSGPLPAAIDLLHAPTLMIETALTTSRKATDVLRLVMLRLLTSVPPGQLQFTIVDAVGLGQDFSAFMHLGDYDEQLINHRIWTEPSHIQTRLADLTQHMESIIQTYLRNEFDSIQSYNEHAGEVAEAYRVLVVSNFPAGFSDEAASRLLSIVSSGPRCGVYTLLSVDPGQSMPRNFDLDDLRKHANVVVVDEDEVRWSEPPLSGFPIQLEQMPTEQRVTEIMYQVGQEARDANRVEVPFSAVALPKERWWQADAAAEIEIPLGRAGATKLQSIKLGHGTSQHVLISGKTGSGKSTLLHGLITNLSLKYSPAEVQFYLIDFKKGVEFKSYAEHRLPHARVIAIESEREFGQSVLQRLDTELRRRGDLFRRAKVQSLAGYRDARPDEPMPRILLVIDEFQEFFVKEDKIAQDAALLLDRLVRQGRAFGIHAVLGSQTLAGAYSLARATIGQMAVRIALQCSATDAHLILSDDNDAARLLRRPGEAIYNDANGTVEGNHPFQVVWLSDVDREHYLRELTERRLPDAISVDRTIVFEGNVAADLSQNELLTNAWNTPAPADVALAPRAWLGEAIAIKEAPAVVFHRRGGTNLLLVGQQEESALGVMASSLLSLSVFSADGNRQLQTRFMVLDGTRPESTEAGYWQHLHEMTGLGVELFKPRDAKRVVAEVCEEVTSRQDSEEDPQPAIFLLIYNLSRFRGLQKSDDDFGFGGFDETKAASSAEQLARILRDGPARGVHTILWSDTQTNLMRWIDRQSLHDVESRVLFQMSATDSSHLMDSSAASQLGHHRGILYSEGQGRAERFRPYGLPSDDLLLSIRSFRSAPARQQVT